MPSPVSKNVRQGEPNTQVQDVLFTTTYDLHDNTINEHPWRKVLGYLNGCVAAIRELRQVLASDLRQPWTERDIQMLTKGGQQLITLL